jgi:D-inositol-3-phosphate glycosyltransferase
MGLSSYAGPSVFGYETDTLRRAAMVSVHTSPRATLGGKDAGGMNVYVRDLACHLARLGLPVDIYTRRSDPNTPETVPLCPGVNVVSITAGPPEPVDKNALFPCLPEFAAQCALYSLRHGVRYDVVHAHYWLSGWAAQLLRRYWETPFVQMFHTTAEMKNRVSAAAHQETPLRASTERRLVDLADSVIAANPDERAHLIWRQHAPADKVCTVPPGVDLDLFTPRDRASSRAQLGIGPDDRVVLFVGRIDPIKGIDTLLDAAHLLAENGQRPCFLFVGGDLDAGGAPTGPLADVAAATRRLGLAGHVRFDGAQPQDELPCYYAAADVVAVPSRYESFGLVAVEAMACGTPVVACRAGGLRFTVEDDVNGYLVPVGDAPALADRLSIILNDLPLRRRLGQGAFAAAQPYAWPAIATQIAHIFQRLADGQRANLCCEEEFYA